MIMRNVLLPEKIGTKRLFNQRVLSVMVQDDCIRGCVVMLKSNVSIIEKLIEIPLSEDSTKNNSDRIQEGLATLALSGSLYDELRVVIPTSITIVKEIELPFTDIEKIRMVIDYEIEPLLPFALDEAIIDFVITKNNKELQSSQILAVAIRKQDLAAILEPFEKSNLKVQTVMVDLFSTYGLYKKIPGYQSNSGSTALVEVGAQGSRVTFLVNGLLKLTRHIPKGLNFIIEHISQEAGVDKATAWNQLQTNHNNILESSASNKIVQTHLMNFLNEIQFTLNSFSLKLNDYEGISKILFSGKITTIPNIMEFVSEFLQIPSEIFDPRKIFETPDVKNKITADIVSHWGLFINPLGAALGPIEFSNFNLRRKELALLDLDLGLRQIITGTILLLSSFIIIGLIGYSNISDLQTVAQSLEADQISRLNTLIPRKDRKMNAKLSSVFKQTEDILKAKTALWSPFGQERIKPLEILLEVTQTLDKNQFRINVDEFILTEKEAGNLIIELEGFFKSDKGLGYHHAEWEQLVDHIKESPLLSLVEPPSTIPAAEKGLKFSIKLQKKRADNASVGQS